MKKLLAVVAVVAVCASFTSCKKDCRCISSYDGKEMTNTVVGQLSKSDCEAYKMEVLDGYKFECKSE